MSESLTPDEGEPLSAMQHLGAHIDRVLASEPVDPNAAHQTVVRHILGNKDSTVTYNRETDGNCKVTVNLNPPLYENPLHVLNPKKYEKGRTFKVLYRPTTANVTDLEEIRNAEFIETSVASLLTLEPMLTKRSGLLGIMELYMRHRRKQS